MLDSEQPLSASPQSICAEVRENGFALFRAYQSSSSLEIAESIGLVENPKDFPIVQALIPKENGGLNSYSGNFGTGNFPLHTDLAHWSRPPRYLLLYCAVPGDTVTHLLRCAELISQLGEMALIRSLVRSRTPLEGRLSLLRLWNGEIFRWDSLFLKPANPTAINVFSGVKEVLEDTRHRKVVLEEFGHSILIDNWRMLHGRGDVTSASTNRRLDRIYLRELRW